MIWRVALLVTAVKPKLTFACNKSIYIYIYVPVFTSFHSCYSKKHEDCLVDG